MKLLKYHWSYYAGGLIVLLIILIEARGKGDFSIFISASEDLLSHKNIYGIQYNEWYHYYYDVVFALILVPFSFLPLYLVKVMWLALNVFFLYRIWKIITHWLPLKELPKNSVMIFTLLSFLFASRFILSNIHLSQVTIMILYFTLEGIYLIEKERKISGSILLAAGITIKLLPVVIIPYLLYRKEFKSVVYILIFIIALFILPAAFIGFEYNTFLLSERWQLINPMNIEHISDTSERSFHSLTTLLSTLLMNNTGDMYALPLKRNIADIPVDSLKIIINVTRALFILFTLYFLRTKPFKNKVSKIQRLYELSYVCILIPLIFPHQQHYAYMFIFPATTYLLYYLIVNYFNKNAGTVIRSFKTKRTLLISGLALVYLSTNSHLILGEYSKYYDHYKTLTYGVLLLIIILAFCKPERDERLDLQTAD